MHGILAAMSDFLAITSLSGVYVFFSKPKISLIPFKDLLDVLSLH